MVKGNDARWWNVTRYCYICGAVARIPIIGPRLVTRHLLRIARKEWWS